MLAVLALQLAVASPGAALACPPSSTQTIPSPDDPGVVLADGLGLVAVRIAGPFEVPWALAFLPDGSFLVTERPGRLQHVKRGSDTYEVSGVPEVRYAGHGGLLDVAVDPHFSETKLVFLSYLRGNETASTMRVLRARYDEDTEALLDAKVIFESPLSQQDTQIGGRLALTDDGYLFLTLGDTWRGDRAQDLADGGGSVIRIRTDGSIPSDNPFVQRFAASPEIWSYGHRNPQGLAYDRVTGQLWEHEHGPQGGDELNLIRPGRNYGWPLATYGVDYSGKPIAVHKEAPGTEQPVHYWVPLSIAPSGIAVVTSGEETTLWISTLAGEMVVQLTLVNDCVIRQKYLLKHQLGRIRDIRVDPDGDVFVVTESGILYRLEDSLGVEEAGASHL
jgi:glucose/arabinose dehydrogenase